MSRSSSAGEHSCRVRFSNFRGWCDIGVSFAKSAASWDRVSRSSSEPACALCGSLWAEIPGRRPPTHAGAHHPIHLVACPRSAARLPLACCARLKRLPPMFATTRPFALLGRVGHALLDEAVLGRTRELLLGRLRLACSCSARHRVLLALRYEAVFAAPANFFSVTVPSQEEPVPAGPDAASAAEASVAAASAAIAMATAVMGVFMGFPHGVETGIRLHSHRSDVELDRSEGGHTSDYIGVGYP